MTTEADILELAGLAGRHPEIAELLTTTLAVGRKLDSQGGIAEIVAAHQAPVTGHRETPEEEEWRRQTDGLIGKGLHEALQYSNPEAYRLTIPQFDPKQRSDGYGRFLAVEPRLTLPALHRLMGITDFIDLAQITNSIRIPKKPYVVCLQSGPVELSVGTFDQAMARIPRNRIPVVLLETDMTELAFPELFQLWIDAGSSRYGAGFVPCLDVNGVRPRVRADRVDDPRGSWRLLSRGKRTWTF